MLSVRSRLRLRRSEQHTRRLRFERFLTQALRVSTATTREITPSLLQARQKRKQSTPPGFKERHSPHQDISPLSNTEHRRQICRILDELSISHLESMCGKTSLHPLHQSSRLQRGRIKNISRGLGTIMSDTRNVTSSLCIMHPQAIHWAV